MADPISYALVGASVLKGGAEILGGIQQNKARRRQGEVADQLAAWETERAAVDSDEYRRKASAIEARQRAIRSGSGVDVNTGTAAATQEEVVKEGEFGAQTLLREGALRSYRLREEADTYRRAGQHSMIGGFISGATSFLTGAKAGHDYFGTKRPASLALATGGKGPGSWSGEWKGSY